MYTRHSVSNKMIAKQRIENMIFYMKIDFLLPFWMLKIVFVHAGIKVLTIF